MDDCLRSDLRVLVVGGDSAIGGALARGLQTNGVSVQYTSRRPQPRSPDQIFLDLSEDLVRFQHRDFPSFDVAVLCAGITSTAMCNVDPILTRKVNVKNVIELAREFSSRGTHIVYISSSCVFSGEIPFARSESTIAPLNEYGRQKAEVELMLSSECESFAIVRFGKVTSRHSTLFVNWLESLSAARAIQAFEDVTVSPIAISFAVKILGIIVLRRAQGIFQASAGNELSYAAVARRLAGLIGADQNLVKLVKGRTLQTDNFPRFATLDSSSLGAIGLKAPELDDALSELTNEFLMSRA